MKKILAIIMCIIILLAMSACGQEFALYDYVAINSQPNITIEQYEEDVYDKMFWVMKENKDLTWKFESGNFDVTLLDVGQHLTLNFNHKGKVVKSVDYIVTVVDTSAPQLVIPHNLIVPKGSDQKLRDMITVKDGTDGKGDFEGEVIILNEEKFTTDLVGYQEYTVIAADKAFNYDAKQFRFEVR